MNPGQEDSDHNGTGDACEPQTPRPPPRPPRRPRSSRRSSRLLRRATRVRLRQTTDGQFVLGERISAPTARLLAATGCAARSFTAGVRGTQIQRVVFKLDGKRIGTVTKKNKAGLYALRVNPNSLKVGVHRLTVTVTFNASTQTKSRTLRGSFQRCGKRLIAPRFTG